MKYLTIALIIALASTVAYTLNLHAKHNKLLGALDAQQEQAMAQLKKVKNEHAKILSQSKAKADAINANLDAANNTAERLRQELSDRASRDATAAEQRACEQDRATERVYSELLGRLSERDRIVSEYADRLAAVGLSCERYYDI